MPTRVVALWLPPTVAAWFALHASAHCWPAWGARCSRDLVMDALEFNVRPLVAYTVSQLLVFNVRPLVAYTVSQQREDCGLVSPWACGGRVHWFWWPTR
jgi:hypothetical protein